MNGYVYGAGDPVNNTDPAGEMLMIDAGGGFVGSAAAIEHMYAQRQREERAAYNRLANQIENQQLENCYCHMSTMQAIIREYHNPVYVQQRVSQYDATAAYDARMLRQAELQRQREAAQARQHSHGCGLFSFVCSAAHWVTHTAVPWVQKNRWAIASWAEVGLGVVSMVTPLGVVADVAFAAGMGLSVLTTAHECASGETGDCAFGAASIGLGGAGFALGRAADSLERASDFAFAQRGFFRPVIKSALLGAASDLTRMASHTNNGLSVVMSGLSNLPCSTFRQPGQATGC